MPVKLRYHDTHVETFRQAEYLGDFSRHMALNENDDVQVRMKAINSKAFASTVVSGRTENYGELPGTRTAG